MSDLKKEFDYYIKHQSELVRKYDGKYIVIKDQEVIGVFDSELKAYEDSIKNHTPGTFLIQPVRAGKDNYTQTFYSRVAF